MTVTVAPEIEELVNQEAHRAGKAPEQVVNETLWARLGIPAPVGHVGPLGEELRARVNAARGAVVPEDLSPEEREKRRQEALERIRSGYFAERLSSSEEFSARKAEEKALEERHWHT